LFSLLRHPKSLFRQLVQTGFFFTPGILSWNGSVSFPFNGSVIFSLSGSVIFSLNCSCVFSKSYSFSLNPSYQQISQSSRSFLIFTKPQILKEFIQFCCFNYILITQILFKYLIEKKIFPK